MCSKGKSKRRCHCIRGYSIRTTALPQKRETQWMTIFFLVLAELTAALLESIVACMGRRFRLRSNGDNAWAAPQSFHLDEFGATPKIPARGEPSSGLCILREQSRSMHTIDENDREE